MRTTRKLFLAVLLAVCSFTVSAQDWQKYSTDTHPKANGVNLTLQYPADWNRREGERPHIVQRFVSPDKRANAMIVIMDLGGAESSSLNAEFLESLFEPQELRSMAPHGAEILGAVKTRIEGMPAGRLDYKITSERAGVRADIRSWMLIFHERTSMVQLQFMVMGPVGSDPEKLMQAYEPIFLAIANSTVLPDRWRAAVQDQKEQADLGRPNTSTTSGMDEFLARDWPSILLISFLVTWGIGLVPPLAIRFMFVRRPVGRMAALGIVAALFITNFLIFAALGSAARTHIAEILIAVISFSILRAGSSKQSE